jgi:hypothetical protein
MVVLVDYLEDYKKSGEFGQKEGPPYRRAGGVMAPITSEEGKGRGFRQFFFCLNAVTTHFSPSG